MMIKLKNMLNESIDWEKPFTLAATDAWEYYHNPVDQILYTRKKGATKWINMETALTPERYDKAYRRIKDAVSGFASVKGSNTGTVI
jgi:hypothetical protein